MSVLCGSRAELYLHHCLINYIATYEVCHKWVAHESVIHSVLHISFHCFPQKIILYGLCDEFPNLFHVDSFPHRWQVISLDFETALILIDWPLTSTSYGLLFLITCAPLCIPLSTHMWQDLLVLIILSAPFERRRNVYSLTKLWEWRERISCTFIDIINVKSSTWLEIRGRRMLV